MPDQLNTTSSRSLRPPPIVVDFTNNNAGLIDNCCHNESSAEANHGGKSILPPPSSPLRIVPPGRMLRRKNDMVIGKRNSAPPDSPHRLTPPASAVAALEQADAMDSAPTPPLTTDSGSSFTPSEVPSDAPAVHNRTQSQPTPSVKLGHPSRPYYTAIRPRPISIIGLSSSPSLTTIRPVQSLTALSRPTSLCVSLPDAARFAPIQRNSAFLDVRIEDGEVIMPTPSALSPPVSLSNGPAHLSFSMFGAGGSASGEAEMRMASGDAAYTFVAPKRHSSGPMSRMKKTLKRMLSFSK